MAEYRLTISRVASKEFEELPATVIERVREKIRALMSHILGKMLQKLRRGKELMQERLAGAPGLTTG